MAYPGKIVGADIGVARREATAIDNNMIDLLVSYVDLEGKGEGECSCCLYLYGVDRDG
jgi:hypothetical protein